MLVVVSDSLILKKEAALINALFDEGLQLFHLRKPETAATGIQQVLEKINPVHLSKVALHQHHALAKMRVSGGCILRKRIEKIQQRKRYGS